jgi:amino acid transporter
MVSAICFIIYVIGALITIGILRAIYISEHNWQENITFSDVFDDNPLFEAMVILWPIALAASIIILIISIISLPTSWVVVKILKKLNK